MLLVDIGNTRTKYIQADRLDSDTPTVILNSDLCEDWLDNHWKNDLEDSSQNALQSNPKRGLYRHSDSSSHKKDTIYVVSVGQAPLVELLQQWCDKQGIELTQIISEQSRFGLATFYEQPKQLGADRWLALLGAKRLYPKKNILVVDAGTATTVDCLQADGQHKGGWILPGIDMMFTSLLADTAHVRGKQQSQAALTFGANSAENVNSASWAATLGMINQSIIQAKEVDCKPDVLIILGGNGKQLFLLMTQSKESKSMKKEPCEILYSEDLIFHGLKDYTIIAV